MRRRIAILASTTAICVGMALGGAGVASAGVTTVGTPGTANCVGQSTAWAAQQLHPFGVNGIGGRASFDGFPVQVLMTLIKGYCA